MWRNKGKTLAGIGILLLFFSCDKKETIPVNKNKNFPSEKIYNAKITEKDSGRVTYQLTAPLIETYGFLDTPYTVFKKGISITFYKYENKQIKTGKLRADYAKVIDKKKWYEARGDIVVVTPDGDTMKTQSFYFNQNTNKITTRDTVKIIRSDNTVIFANKGLESASDFSWYKLYENRNSEVMLKD